MLAEGQKENWSGYRMVVVTCFSWTQPTFLSVWRLASNDVNYNVWLGFWYNVEPNPNYFIWSKVKFRIKRSQFFYWTEREDIFKWSFLTIFRCQLTQLVSLSQPKKKKEKRLLLCLCVFLKKEKKKN